MNTRMRLPVLRALSWAAGTKALGQILSWAITLYVIRLLTPKDYGIMALAMVFVSILGPLSELGLGAALIQTNNLTEKLIRQVCGFALLVSTGLSGLLVVTAPFVARLFDSPDLSKVLSVLSLSLVIAAFAVAPRAILLRRLELRSTSLVELSCTLCGGLLTLYLAHLGQGVWALVWGHLLAQTLVAGILVYVAATPARPQFNLRGIRSSLAFGSWVMLDRLLWMLWSQADIFVIGKMLGDTRLGSYAMAKELAQLPQAKVQGAINAVAFPAYAKAHRSRSEPTRYLGKYIRLSALLSFPVFWGIALTAPVFVPLLLGEKWTDAVFPLQIIAFAMPLRVAQAAVSPYLQAIGQARLATGNMAIGLALMATAVVAGSWWDIIGVSLGWAFAAGMILLVVLYRTARVSDLSPLAVLRQLARAAGPAGIMVGAVLAIDYTSALAGYLHLSALILGGMVAYGLAAIVFCPKELSELVGLFRTRGSA